MLSAVTLAANVVRKPARSVLFLILLSTALVVNGADFFSSAQQTSERDPRTLLTVRQLVADGEVFFYDPLFQDRLFIKQLFFRARNSVTGEYNTEPRRFSNILIRVYPPRPGFAGAIRNVPTITTWVDRKGHIHSLRVLEMQLRFNNVLIQEKGLCAGGCEFTAGRLDPLKVSPVPLTGILDQSTLHIPLMELELRFDRVSRRFQVECQSRQGEICSVGRSPNIYLQRLAGELSAARDLLNEYAKKLSLVPRHKPRPMSFQNAHAWFVPNGKEYGGGLEEEPLPGNADYFKYFRERDWFVLSPTGNEPEAFIEEAVDLAGLTPAVSDHLELYRREAGDAVQRIEALAGMSTHDKGD